MVLGHAMCPTAVAVAAFAAAIDASAAIDAVSTWAYGYAPLEICYISRVGRWQKVNLSMYKRIERMYLCVCVGVFVFVAHYLSLHSDFRSLFFQFFFVSSVLVSGISNTIANAHETQSADAREENSLYTCKPI